MVCYGTITPPSNHLAKGSNDPFLGYKQHLPPLVFLLLSLWLNSSLPSSWVGQTMLQHAGVVVSHNINNCVKYAHAYFFYCLFWFFFATKVQKKYHRFGNLVRKLVLVKIFRPSGPTSSIWRYFCVHLLNVSACFCAVLLCVWLSKCSRLNLNFVA